MKVVVIDNDNVFLKQFLVMIEPLCNELYKKCEIISYSKFQQDIENNSDVIFLDIDLDDINGIDIAKQIRDGNKNTKIIFVTSNNHLVYNALTVQPFYFIRKNQLESDLSTAFTLLKDAVQEKDIYSFQYNGMDKSIYIEDIVYIDVNDHLCSLHMSNKQEYHFYKPLSKIVKEIDSDVFCQIHKKYYVNLKYVKLMKRNTVKLLNGDEFIVGRKYKDSIIEAFGKYGNGE